MNCPRTIILGLVDLLNHIIVLIVLSIHEGSECSRRSQHIAKRHVPGLWPSSPSIPNHSVPPIAFVGHHVTSESMVDHTYLSRLCIVLWAASGRVALLPAFETRALVHRDNWVPASSNCMTLPAAVHTAEVSLLCSPWPRGSRWSLCSPLRPRPLHAAVLCVAREVPRRLSCGPLISLLLGEDKNVLQLLTRHVCVRVDKRLVVVLVRDALGVNGAHEVHIH